MSEREQFSELVEPHVMAMLRVAAAMIGASHAEDAVQEALIKAWRALPSLREQQYLHAWLLRITLHVCQDRQREKYSNLTKLLIPLDDVDDGQLAALGGPGSENHISSLDLRQAIRRLDPELQLIILLRYYAGENSSEISFILGISASTVRTRLSQAIARLRNILGHADIGLSVGGTDG